MFRFSRNESFLKEIMKYLGKTQLEAKEIGDGILAVKQTDDYDIFFDTGRWKVKITVKSEFREMIFPCGLDNGGVFPGRLFKGGTRTEERVIIIVKQKLVPAAQHYKLVTDKEEEKKANPFSDIFGKGPFDGIFGNIFK